MGSFCVTCGVSGQVIADDDRCVAIPIIQQSTFEPVKVTFNGETHSLFGIASDTCYPNCFWEPAGAFVTGVYADYGRINPDDTPANRRAMVEFFMDMLKAPVVEEGSNDCHDLPFDMRKLVEEHAPELAKKLKAMRHREHLDTSQLAFDELEALWEDIWEVADEHRLFASDTVGHVRPMQFALFHGHAFDALVKMAENSKTYRGEPYELGQFLARLLDELASKSDGAGDETLYFVRGQMLAQLNLGLTDSVHAMLLAFNQEHENLLDRHLERELSREDFVEALRPSMNGVYAVKAMHMLNLRFSPVVYAGQDYSNELGQSLVKFIAGVSEKVTADCRSRYGD